MNQTQVLGRLLELCDLCKEHKDYSRQYGKVTGATIPTTSIGPCRVYALDCEMVLCRNGKQSNPTPTLARVSLVECNLDSFKPKNEIQLTTAMDEYVVLDAELEVVDYVTAVSGIEAHHLTSPHATKTHEELIQQVQEILAGNTILLGHSLDSDFAAMRLIHQKVIDPAFLVEIKNVPFITLSLKDCVDITTKLLSEGGILDRTVKFQEFGASHDSVVDAQWSAKVVFDMLHLEQAMDKSVVPMKLEKVPERFRRRLTIQNIPKGSNGEFVTSIVQRLSTADVATEAITVKPIRWKKAKNGSTYGTSAIDCTSESIAQVLFNNVTQLKTGCGGYMQSPPSCPDGYPSKEGFLTKPYMHPASGGKIVKVASYFQVDLDCVLDLSIKKQLLGKVIGRGGKKIHMIQECSGTYITSNRDGDTGIMTIKADKVEKLQHAKKLIEAAAAGEYSDL